MSNTGHQIGHSEAATSFNSSSENGKKNSTRDDNSDINVREFIVLACLYEEGETDINCTATHAGLSPAITLKCLEALIASGLVCAVGSSPATFLPTEDGRAFIRTSRYSGHL